MIDVPFSLRRVPLDLRGRDARGTYWGEGGPLWLVEYRPPGAKEVRSSYFRAPDNSPAMNKVRALVAETVGCRPGDLRLRRRHRGV